LAYQTGPRARSTPKTCPLGGLGAALIAGNRRGWLGPDAVIDELLSGSEIEANAAASSVMGDAWTASRIDALPGNDFDISSLRVELR
jgi:hypothetical protein